MLHKNGRNKNYLLHRLIAENFIPNIENKPCVDHINGKRDDNRIENLRWCTHKENNNFFLARKHNHEAQQLLLKNEEFVRRRAEASRQAMKREDVREKMRLIALQRIDKGEKGVCKYDLNGILISEYSSIANATRDTGISNSRIINCCNGRTKTAGGFQWKYKEVNQ